jgi:hypothetical protein
MVDPLFDPDLSFDTEGNDSCFRGFPGNKPDKIAIGWAQGDGEFFAGGHKSRDLNAIL